MSSLVSEFIINPVLRQARRFSEISRSTLAGEEDVAPAILPENAEVVEPPSPTEEDTAAPGLENGRARLPSSSTQNMVVEDPGGVPIAASVAADRDVPHDHLGFPFTPPRKTLGPIPEDDGMQVLRQRIHAINSLDVSNSEKARLIHDILLERYRASSANTSQARTSGEEAQESRAPEQPGPTGPLESLKFWQNQIIGDSSPRAIFNLTENDIRPTYVPIRTNKHAGSETAANCSPPQVPGPLGCEHYGRNVKLECSTCKKWYTCRFCHDAQEDHTLIRKDTKHMLCMICATPQKAAEACANCGEIAAQYYCNICKLWENRPSKPIYHCNDCGICRRGMGLGKDFFHCKTCRACITISIESSHKCIERSTDCDCPICGEYLFTSPTPVVFMGCGHSIHKRCYDQHMKVSYKCPICNKSLTNMESQFRNLDIAISGQPMPPDFQDTKAKILCNDCSGRSTVPYHWLGLKCSICLSYNTVELQLLGRNSEATQGSALDRSSESQEVLRDRSRPNQQIVSEPRFISSAGGRRRHSSNTLELPTRSTERIARSMSPTSNMTRVMQPFAFSSHMELDEESDDDRFGFWGGGGGDSSEDCAESEEESSDDDDLDDEDEDDDDEDEINLIGHR